MTASDAIYAGLADYYVPSARLSELAQSLLEDGGLDPGAVIAHCAEQA